MVMDDFLELMCLIYCVQSSVGSLVDSSETVILSHALRLLCLTLRSASILYISAVLFLLLLIYCVLLNDHAVDS